MTKFGNDLTIQVRASSKLFLLGGGIALALIAVLTANIWGVEGTFGTIILVSVPSSIFFFILAINANFERLRFVGKEVRYRYFLFVERKTDRDLIEQVTLGQRSGRLRVMANGRRFATLNIGVLDISEEDFITFIEKQNIPLELEDA